MLKCKKHANVVSDQYRPLMGKWSCSPRALLSLPPSLSVSRKAEISLETYQTANLSAGTEAATSRELSGVFV